MSSNPAADMVPMSADEPDPLRTHVTDEWEYRALLATCRRKTQHGAQRACDRRDAAILALMWETGCRRAEVTKVDMRHVNLREGIIHLVGTKGRGGLKARDVILGDEAADAISFYVFGPGGRGDHDGPLFESIAYLPGTNRRRPLRPDSVGLMLQRRAEEANKTQRLPAKIRGLAHGFRRASAINDIDDGIWPARSSTRRVGSRTVGCSPATPAPPRPARATTSTGPSGAAASICRPWRTTEWAMRDLNPRPSACHADALAT